MRIAVGSTDITEEHKKAVLAVLSSNHISPGPRCREFEEKFADAHNAKHGLFVNSGTDALRIALLALKEKHGWPDGSRVVVPASTFVATANIVIQAGLSPELVDVSMYDSLLNTHMLERVLYGNGTKVKGSKEVVCVVPVHLFGKICDMGHLLELKRRYNFAILEDSCESMGVAKIYGDVACYSTYVCHLISTGVGGLAITNDRKLSDLMRSYANHGRDASHIPGHRVGKMEDRFKFDRIGYSSRATELQAALGLVELKNLEKNIQRRREIAKALMEGLSGIRQLTLPYYLESTPHAFMMFPIVVKGDKWELCRYLEKNGIETRDWLNLVGQPCYDGKIDMDYLGMAKSFRVSGFYIGSHPSMTDADVKYVVKTFRNYFKK